MSNSALGDRIRISIFIIATQAEWMTGYHPSRVSHFCHFCPCCCCCWYFACLRLFLPSYEPWKPFSRNRIPYLYKWSAAALLLTLAWISRFSSALKFTPLFLITGFNLFLTVYTQTRYAGSMSATAAASIPCTFSAIWSQQVPQKRNCCLWQLKVSPFSHLNYRIRRVIADKHDNFQHSQQVTPSTPPHELIRFVVLSFISGERLLCRETFRNVIKEIRKIFSSRINKNVLQQEPCHHQNWASCAINQKAVIIQGERQGLSCWERSKEILSFVCGSYKNFSTPNWSQFCGKNLCGEIFSILSSTLDYE